jgi:hypothetical protein
VQSAWTLKSVRIEWKWIYPSSSKMSGIKCILKSIGKYFPFLEGSLITIKIHCSICYHQLSRNI